MPVINARIMWTAIMLMAAMALAACSPGSEAPTSSDSAGAASQAREHKDVRSFTIGDLPAMALRDGALSFPNDNKIIGVGRTPAEVASLLTAAGLPTDELQLDIQPLLVKASGRVLLFDTGAGASFGPSAGKLSASLAAVDVDPQSITDVFISHSHGDHVGGLLNAEGEPAFPNATIHISTPEWAFLKGWNAEMAAGAGIGTRYAALIAAMTARVAEFAPNADIMPGVVKAVEIRGHTPGHSGYMISSGQDSLLYIGDAMHHFVVSVQKPQWTIQFDVDAPTAQASRSDLLARSASSSQRIYAVHFPFPGVGKVEHKADTFVWVAE